MPDAPTRTVFLAVALIASIMAPSAARPDMESAIAATEAGNYAEAEAELRRLAEQGLAEAQNALGDLYRDGRGVEQDPQEAVHWYRLAARQGNWLAQSSLGEMYFDGTGVPENRVRAQALAFLANDSLNAALEAGILSERRKMVDRFRVRGVFYHLNGCGRMMHAIIDCSLHEIPCEWTPENYSTSVCRQGSNLYELWSGNPQLIE